MSLPGSHTEDTTSTRLNPAISEGFDKRLVAYAAVAGAGLLASAPSAVAGVIYNPTTFGNDYPYPPSSAFSIDLNGDAQNDFLFGTSAGYSFRNFIGYGIGGAQLLGVGGGWDALFVPGSNTIGPGNSPWTASSARLAGASGYWTSYGGGSTWLGWDLGQFTDKGEGYLGVRIPTGQPDSYNYGWIRFYVAVDERNTSLPILATVRGWAYESVADTAIHAGDEGGVPEPGSLGLLAGGILGLAAWRRRKAAKG